MVENFKQAVTRGLKKVRSPHVNGLWKVLHGQTLKYIALDWIRIEESKFAEEIKIGPLPRSTLNFYWYNSMTSVQFWPR